MIELARFFKSPKDDATEETLRALHTQNVLDTYYEKGWGWIRTILFTTFGILGASAYELQTGISVWENTVQWFWNQLADFGNWLIGD